MANSIDFTKNYTGIIDEVYQRAGVSGVLNSGRRMVRAGHNAKEIMIPKEIYQNIEIPEDVILGIRPENIAPVAATEEGFDLKVDVAELLGNEYYAHSKFGGIDLVAKFPVTKVLQTGDIIHVAFHTDKIHFFDPESEKAYL